MGMMEMFAKKKEEKMARLSKTDGPKLHVFYGIHTRTAGRPAADLKNTHFQQLTRYASAKNYTSDTMTTFRVRKFYALPASSEIVIRLQSLHCDAGFLFPRTS